MLYMTSECAADGHVLVVEDDQDLRDALRDALALEGYRVVGAANGADALRHLESGSRPCLILLDLMMPVMDGWEFRRVVLGNPTLADIPVVVMTAAGARRAEGIAATQVLEKPLEMDTVVDIVQTHC